MERPKTVNINTAIRRLAYIFMALFVALSGGMVYWQIAQAQFLTTYEHNPRRCLHSVQPVRGNIYDRNGVLLAQSVSDPNYCGGYRRTYTDPTLAPVIGYLSDRYGETGIEASYDNYLTGQAGGTIVRAFMDQLLHQAPVGDDIYLTIDERIQQIAEQAFQNAPGTGRGAVIVEDPHT